MSDRNKIEINNNLEPEIKRRLGRPTPETREEEETRFQQHLKRRGKLPANVLPFKLKKKK